MIYVVVSIKKQYCNNGKLNATILFVIYLLKYFLSPDCKLGLIVLYCSLQEILDYFEEETTPEIPTIGSREGQLFIAV